MDKSTCDGSRISCDCIEEELSWNGTEPMTIRITGVNISIHSMDKLIE